MVSPKDMELIDRYLNGELSSVELRQLENRMVNDKDFADYVSFAKDLRVSLKHAQRQDLKKKLQNISVKYEYEGAGNEVGAASKSKSIWSNYLSIAATVVFLFIAAGIGYYFGIAEKHQELASFKQELERKNVEIENYQNEIEWQNKKGFGFVEVDSTVSGYGPSAIEKMRRLEMKKDSIRMALETERQNSLIEKMASIDKDIISIEKRVFYFAGVLILGLMTMVVFLILKNKNQDK